MSTTLVYDKVLRVFQYFYGLEPEERIYHEFSNIATRNEAIAEGICYVQDASDDVMNPQITHGGAYYGWDKVANKWNLMVWVEEDISDFGYPKVYKIAVPTYFMDSKFYRLELEFTTDPNFTNNVVRYDSSTDAAAFLVFTNKQSYQPVLPAGIPGTTGGGDVRIDLSGNQDYDNGTNYFGRYRWSEVGTTPEAAWNPCSIGFGADRELAPELTDVELKISGPTRVYENTTGQYTCQVKRSDNAWVDITPEWSTIKSVATVANIASTGLLTVGALTVTETIKVMTSYNGLVGSLEVEVHHLVVTDRVIVGPSAVNESTTASYMLEEHFSDGTKSFKTSGLTWEISPYGTVDTEGNVTIPKLSADAVSELKVTLSAGVFETKSITLNHSEIPYITGLSIEGPRTVLESQTPTYKCFATYDNGDIVEVAATFTTTKGSFTGAVFTPPNVTVEDSTVVTATFNGMSVTGSNQDLTVTETVYIVPVVDMTATITIPNCKNYTSATVRKAANQIFDHTFTFSETAFAENYPTLIGITLSNGTILHSIKATFRTRLGAIWEETLLWSELDNAYVVLEPKLAVNLVAISMTISV